MCLSQEEQNEKQRLPRQGCPCYDTVRQVCRASAGEVIPDRQQQMRYCAGDGYDKCPLYIGYAH